MWIDESMKQGHGCLIQSWIVFTIIGVHSIIQCHKIWKCRMVYFLFFFFLTLRWRQGRKKEDALFLCEVWKPKLAYRKATRLCIMYKWLKKVYTHSHVPFSFVVYVIETNDIHFMLGFNRAKSVSFTIYFVQRCSHGNMFMSFVLFPKNRS